MYPPIFDIPKDCGRRLLPVLIDELATTDPNKIFISVGKTANAIDGFEDITFKALAMAINRCAWWIEENLGPSTNFETLFTYLDPQDIRHAILIFAAIKTGYKMFFSSWSNNIDTHILLLEKAQCNVFLLPATRSPVPRKILAKKHMQVIKLPELECWLQESDLDVAVYEYKKTYENACHDPFVVLHSSGTTGYPKLLTLAHGSLNPHDSYQMLPSRGSSYCHTLQWRKKRVFTSFPWFHGAGLYFLHASIVNGFVPVVMPQAIVDAKVSNSVHLYGDVQSCLLSPSILVDISKNPDLLANMRHLEFAAYVGGPLNCDAAEKILAHTILTVTLGATECGMLPTEFPKELGPGDWQYLKYPPELGYKFSHFEENLYELVIVRKKELEAFQGVFFTFPELQDYPTRDLYIQHPKKNGWWRHCGRKDDVIVFLDIRKLNPIAMEGVIETHHSITTAIICGHARSRPALLINPTVHPKTAAEKCGLLEDIWPVVLKAMEDCPPAGKLITKELVVFTSPEKPFPRTAGKGTVVRKRALELYQDELDKAYAAFGAA